MDEITSPAHRRNVGRRHPRAFTRIPPTKISADFAIANLRLVDAFDRFLDPAIEIGAQSYRWLESCLWQPLPLQ